MSQLQNLEREISALETRAADLAPQAADATQRAQNAQADLMAGTGSPAAVATAQGDAAALNDALRVIMAQARAKRGELAALRADAQRKALETHAVETALRAANFARELEDAAKDASDYLERFAALALTAKAAHEREQSAYIAQVKELTAADEINDVHYHSARGATLARLEAQGAPNTNAPDLRALPFGAQLLDAMKGRAPDAYFYVSPAPALAPVAPPAADAPRLYGFQSENDVSMPV